MATGIQGAMASMTMRMQAAASGKGKSAVPIHPVALLVIDMQEMFRAISKDMLPNVLKLVDRCRAKHVPVIYTQHGYLNLEHGAGAALRKWGPSGCCLVNTKQWQLMPEAGYDPEKGDLLIQKHRYDAFHGTELLSLLQATGCRTVAIAGLTTNLCCESTARSAFMLDFDVWFLSDGTGAENQELHKATELNMGYGFADVITCEEMAKKL